MPLDVEAMGPDELLRHRQSQQQRVIAVPRASAAAGLLSIEILRLLEVQFRMEDALLAAKDTGLTDPDPRLAAVVGHLDLAIPLCQAGVFQFFYIIPVPHHPHPHSFPVENFFPPLVLHKFVSFLLWLRVPGTEILVMHLFFP